MKMDNPYLDMPIERVRADAIHGVSAAREALRQREPGKAALLGLGVSDKKARESSPVRAGHVYPKRVVESSTGRPAVLKAISDYMDGKKPRRKKTRKKTFDDGKLFV
jgi:hypothetical protein